MYKVNCFVGIKNSIHPNVFIKNVNTYFHAYIDA